jgi:hypothetical protein
MYLVRKAQKAVLIIGVRVKLSVIIGVRVKLSECLLRAISCQIEYSLRVLHNHA